MDCCYFGIHRCGRANHGVIGGENPSFPNKVIIRISGVFLFSLGCINLSSMQQYQYNSDG